MILFQAWLNEKFAPELLENKSEMVECVMEQLTHMVGVIGIRAMNKNSDLYFSVTCVCVCVYTGGKSPESQKR